MTHIIHSPEFSTPQSRRLVRLIALRCVAIRFKPISSRVTLETPGTDNLYLRRDMGITSQIERRAEYRLRAYTGKTSRQYRPFRTVRKKT
jgi:hypothetical protein